jgi:choice-of-anchor B domain-containing protein
MRAARLGRFGRKGARPLRCVVLAAAVGGALLLASPGLAHPDHGEPPPPPPPPAEGSGSGPCIDGFAGGFACRYVDLLAHLPLTTFSAGLGFANDLWGWTDPESGREFAILGLTNGVVFVEVTDPEAPVYLGNLRAQTAGSFWGDFKTYAGYAYAVSEAPGQGLEVFDLRQLLEVADPPADFQRTAHYTGFSTAHNLAIDEATGFAYAVGSDSCGGGLHMLDLADPEQPAFAGCYDQNGYVHDTQCVVYAGPDLEHVGREICVNSNTDHVAIVDVTDHAQVRELSVSTYPGSAYTHQGWLTEDHRYFLLGDEEDEIDFGHGTRTYVWDVGDLDAPVLVGSYTADDPATDHNLYVRGDHVYEANYSSGLRVLRMGDLAKPELVEVAYFDTFPGEDVVGTGIGAWSVYPFFPSGTVIVSDIATGLFVLGVHTNGVPECSDGIDNDGDGAVDAGADPGCLVAEAPVEDPACDDGVDNDGDGHVDADDPECTPEWPFWEAAPCGLGAELVLLVPLLAWRSRARAASGSR